MWRNSSNPDQTLMIINSDYPTFAGVLFKFNEESILRIEGNDNDTLKESSLVVNFYKRIPFVPEEPKQKQDNRLLFILIVVGCGGVILLIIVGCCVLKKMTAKQPHPHEEGMPF